MKIDVAKQIVEIILDKGEVRVPGLGNFKTINQPAKLATGKTKIGPPQIDVSFDEESGDSDELLNRIKKTFKLRKNEAEKVLDQFAEKVLNNLVNFDKVRITGLGMLAKSKNNRVAFTANKGFVTQYYKGLPEVSTQIGSKPRATKKVTPVKLVKAEATPIKKTPKKPVKTTKKKKTLRKAVSKVSKSTKEEKTPSKVASKIVKTTKAEKTPSKVVSKVTKSTKAEKTPRKAASKETKTTKAEKTPSKVASKVAKTKKKPTPIKAKKATTKPATKIKKSKKEAPVIKPIEKVKEVITSKPEEKLISTGSGASVTEAITPKIETKIATSYVTSSTPVVEPPVIPPVIASTDTPQTSIKTTEPYLKPVFEEEKKSSLLWPILILLAVVIGGLFGLKKCTNSLDKMDNALVRNETLDSVLNHFEGEEVANAEGSTADDSDGEANDYNVGKEQSVETGTDQIVNEDGEITVSPDKCIIITGVFKSERYAKKMIRELKTAGYIPYAQNYGELLRVGFEFDCGETDLENFLRSIRTNISNDAWYLQPALVVN